MNGTDGGAPGGRLRVAVTGATGKTGRALTASLRSRGVGVRALVRDPSRIADGTTGVQAAEVDLADEHSLPALTVALEGCDAVYLMAPNLFADEPALTRRVLAAARTAGVPRVVHHSVAQPYAPRMPHHLDKAVSEDEVRRAGLRWTVLQPCAYTQNLLPGLRKTPPALSVPYSADTPFCLVDLLDVAEAAATVLTGDGHDGATYELGGPQPVTVRDVARLAADVLDEPVDVMTGDPSTWERDAGAGLDTTSRTRLAAMFRYYDAYGLLAGSLTTEALLGRRPATVHQVLQRELGGPR